MVFLFPWDLDFVWFPLTLNSVVIFTESEDYSDSSDEEEEDAPVAASVNAAKAVAKPEATPATVTADVQPEEDESDFDSEEGVSFAVAFYDDEYKKSRNR